MAANSSGNGNALALVGGVAMALAFQIIFTLLGLGAGILAASPATAGTFMAAFIWWAASGIVASAVAGYVVGIISDERDSARLGLLALIAWAIAGVLAATTAGLSTAGGFLSNLGGPASDLLAQIRGSSGSDFARKTMGVAALASAAALVLGAAAATFMAIEGHSALNPTRRSRR
jgi:hypothetical protein